MSRSTGLICAFAVALLFPTAGAGAPARHSTRPPPTLEVEPLIVPVAPRRIAAGSRERRVVALTFDACSSRGQRRPRYDPAVIGVLQAHGVKANLMLGGRWIEAHPDEVRAFARDPNFELGVHGYYHDHMTRLSPKRIRADLMRAVQALYSTAGLLPAFWRAPFAEVSAKVVNVAATAGLTTIQHDVASGDPSLRATAKRLATYVLRKAQPGSIIVFHMNIPSRATAEALPEILAGLQQQDLTPVKLSEMIDGLAPPRPVAGLWGAVGGAPAVSPPP